jgi:hypothetical protein
MKTRQSIEAAYQRRIELCERMASRSTKVENRIAALKWKDIWEERIDHATHGAMLQDNSKKELMRG